MKSVIYKYQLALVTEQEIELPIYHNILKVAIQNGVLTLWVKVESEAPTTVKRKFFIFGTGKFFNDEKLNYLDTVFIDSYVWHIFYTFSGEAWGASSSPQEDLKRMAEKIKSQTGLPPYHPQFVPQKPLSVRVVDCLGQEIKQTDLVKYNGFYYVVAEVTDEPTEDVLGHYVFLFVRWGVCERVPSYLLEVAKKKIDPVLSKENPQIPAGYASTLDECLKKVYE